MSGASSKLPVRGPFQGGLSGALLFKVAFQGSLSKVTWKGRYPKRPVRGIFKVVNQGWFQGGLSRPSSRWPVRGPFQGGLSGPGPYSRPPCLVPDQDGLSGALFKRATA